MVSPHLSKLLTKLETTFTGESIISQILEGCCQTCFMMRKSAAGSDFTVSCSKKSLRLCKKFTAFLPRESVLLRRIQANKSQLE